MILPIYIVSLQKDIEKRETIKKKLDSLDIKFEFIDAIYGKELPVDFVKSLSPVGKILERGFLPTPGEIGCTLSHLKIYKLMLERNQTWACILEDDAILDERMQDFYTNFYKCENSLVEDNLYLMGGQNGLDSLFVIKSLFGGLTIGKQKFYKTVKSEEYIFRTCCYFISLKIAKSLIDLSEKKFILADDWDFLVKNKYIQEIYLADFVDHPVDLSLSSIEEERQEGWCRVNYNKAVKLNLIIKLWNFFIFRLKRYLKFILIQIYRFK